MHLSLELRKKADFRETSGNYGKFASRTVWKIQGHFFPQVLGLAFAVLNKAATVCSASGCQEATLLPSNFASIAFVLTVIIKWMQQ